MPLITLHNLQGLPRVIDTADIMRYFPSRFGPYTRVTLKYEVLDIQEDPDTITRRIKEAKTGGPGA